MILLLTLFPVLFNLVQKKEQGLPINILIEIVNHTSILIASTVWPKLFKEHSYLWWDVFGIIELCIKISYWMSDIKLVQHLDHFLNQMTQILHQPGPQRHWHQKWRPDKLHYYVEAV